MKTVKTILYLVVSAIAGYGVGRLWGCIAQKIPFFKEIFE